MIVLDTTVLVYATGGDHPLRAPARDLVGALASGELRATTTAEVIQEFAYVRARRTDRSRAARLALEFEALLAPLVPVTDAELATGFAIWETTPALGSFDSILAAVARSHGAPLVSADQAFTDVADLDHVRLDADVIDRLRGI